LTFYALYVKVASFSLVANFMDIFVASTGEQKLNSVRQACEYVFPDKHLNVGGQRAKSSINEQPEGFEEIIKGALNRLKDLKKIIAGIRYDLLVAIENGIYSVKTDGKEEWFDLAWIVIEDDRGNQHYGHSIGIEFPEAAVAEARRRGFDTTTVGAVLSEWEQSNSKDPQSRLTSFIKNRESILEESIRIVLTQFLPNISTNFNN